jgi:hypothetical protein
MGVITASLGLSFSVDTARSRRLPGWRHLGCIIDESSKRMGAARFGHRTPGTVPGLPHPNPHGRHTEAHMEPKHGGSIMPCARLIRISIGLAHQSRRMRRCSSVWVLAI